MHPKKVILLVLLFSSLLPAALAAKMLPVRKVRHGVPPYQVLGNVFAANNQRVAGKDAAIREAERGPDLTWLTDCEAKIRPELVTASGQRPFTVRTLANQLVSGLAAVDFGIRHLHTSVLLITSNTGNETIRLYMEGYQRLEPEIRQELDHLHLALGAPTRPAAIGKKFAEQWLTNIERNVDYQVKQAIDRYQERVADGRLVVAGTILDLDGAYGRGKDRLLLINLNGETDPEKIRQSPHLARFPKDARTLSVGRQRMEGKR
ncbi:MAG: carbonic anhydrase [Deltaproteobacteria bacterium]|jgi:carbonic anhydrase